jgi:hypothetical protein
MDFKIISAFLAAVFILTGCNDNVIRASCHDGYIQQSEESNTDNLKDSRKLSEHQHPFIVNLIKAIDFGLAYYEKTGRLPDSTDQMREFCNSSDSNDLCGFIDYFDEISFSETAGKKLGISFKKEAENLKASGTFYIDKVLGKNVDINRKNLKQFLNNLR